MNPNDIDRYADDANEMQNDDEEVIDRLAPGVSFPEQDEAQRASSQ